MSAPSRWTPVRAPNAPVLPAATSRFGVVVPPRPPPVKAPEPPPAPEPAPVEIDTSEPPVPLPKDARPGRRKKPKPREKRAISTTARTFNFPVSLLARLERFGLGQTERTGRRFNFSAYMTAILEADLAKRGF